MWGVPVRPRHHRLYRFPLLLLGSPDTARRLSASRIGRSVRSLPFRVSTESNARRGSPEWGNGRVKPKPIYASLAVIAMALIALPAAHCQEPVAPDLVVSDLAVTPDPSLLGTQLTATLAAYNAGGGVAQESTTAFWWHRTSVPGDGTGASATWAESALGPYTRGPLRTLYYTPSAVGSYTAWGMVDCWNTVNEPNEANNTASEPYEVKAPELTVSSFSVAPDPSHLGVQLTGSVVCYNGGNAAAGGFTTGLWFHRTTPPTVADTPDATWAESGLGVGQYTPTRTVMWTPATVGNYTAWAFVDCYNNLPEPDENNNTASDAYQVTLSDLTVSTLEVVPDPSNLGTELTLRVRGFNAGVVASGAFRMAVWEHRLTPPSDGSGADAYWDEASLPPGGYTTVRTHLFTPSAVGVYMAWGMVDTEGAVEETNEDNNTLEDAYEVKAPELEVAWLTVTPSPSVLGTELEAEVVGHNAGNAAAGPFRMAFWEHRASAPTDSTDADATWDESGLGIGEDTPTRTHRWTPSAVGDYLAWAMVDTEDALVEPDEANNTRSEPYEVDVPDLTIADFSVVPDDSTLGTQLTASITGRNDGEITSPAFRMAFWEHSPTPPVDETGASFAWEEPGLPPREETSTIYYRFVPAAMGSYTAYAMIDTAGVVPESDEDNNVESQPYVVRAVDLVVSAISVVPDPSGLGTSVIASITVRNNGNLAAGPFTVALWRNRTPAPVDGTGASTTWDVAGLPASGEWTTTSTYKVTTIGQKRAWALADCWNDVTEVSEANNAANVRYATEGCDLVVSELTVAPDPSDLGTELTADITVRNQSAYAATAFSVAFWQDRATAPADGAGADMTWPVPSLAPLTDWATSIKFTPSAEGHYLAWAMADCWRQVTEGNETNNTTSDPYVVGDTSVPPDLYVSELTVVPDPSLLGTVVTVTIRVANQGGPIGNWFTVALWRNRTPAPVDGSGASDTWAVPGLASSGQWTTTSSFRSTSVGLKRAWVMADCWNTVGESSETNNAANKRWTVY